MSRLTISGILCLAIATLLSSCASAPRQFRNKAHRRDFAMTLEEIQQLQFYVSMDVLLQPEEASGTDPGAPGALLVRQGTRGAVLDGGEDWLRVSFDVDGSGVVFAAARGSAFDSAYYLASEVEGQDGYVLLRDMPNSILLHEGRRYRVMRGAYATLMVDDDDLDDLIETREFATGRDP